MKFKMKGIIGLVALLTVLLIGGFFIFGDKKVDVVGVWCDKSGEKLEFYDDGKWDIDSNFIGYGGTYSYLDDGSIEMVGAFGDVYVATIEENELGTYVLFEEDEYYKDAYPEEKVSEYLEKNATAINPFDNLRFDVSGISPYCKLVINNELCDEAVQQFVTYTTDKALYAQGEKATISATLMNINGREMYKLSETEMQYDINSAAKYITSVDEIDLELLKKQIDDKILSIVSAAKGNDSVAGVWKDDILDTSDFDEKGILYDVREITSVESVYHTAYISSLKGIKENMISGDYPYNKYTELYKLDVSGKLYCYDNEGGGYLQDCKGTMYVSVTAQNIVLKKDGTYSWGDASMRLDIETSTDSYENFVANTVTSYSEDYNIKQIEN